MRGWERRKGRQEGGRVKNGMEDGKSKTYNTLQTAQPSSNIRQLFTNGSNLFVFHHFLF